MSKTLLLYLFIAIMSLNCFAQPNGQIDEISDLSTVYTVPFTMPDGTKLMTNIYLPITSDSLTLPIDLGFGPVNIEIIPIGVQYLVYDSINGDINPNKYQLPLILSRTPYNINSGGQELQWFFNLFGFCYANQDNRGRYSSEGVYYPLYSDVWRKDAYHPNSSINIDITQTTDPHNSIFHEDGRDCINFITDSLKQPYDLDYDGNIDTIDFVYNGCIGMVGASATGYAQYQAASAIRINPNNKGLKALMPCVATNEHYNTTLYNNGVFRQALVSNWMGDQLDDVTDTISADTSLLNSLHSNFDYGGYSSSEILDLSLDFVTNYKINGISACSPNSFIRTDMDANYAPIDINGNSSSTSSINRYSNLEVPIYHLTGWWDIFINGQIDTYNNCMDNLSDTYGNKQKQKIIIGPWSHTTIGETQVADMTYKENVKDVTRLSIDNIGLNLSEIVKSEMLLWYRYNLNYNPDFYTGQPKFFIPESNKWQQLDSTIFVRIPSEDYYASFNNFLNFLTGHENFENLKFELDNDGTIDEYTTSIDTDTSNAILPGNYIPPEDSMYLDFAAVPNVRLYVVGPINDNVPENDSVGNYWFNSDKFPLDSGVVNTPYYMHSSGILDTIIPASDEGYKQYTHNPNNPVYSIGGNNFTFPTPSGVRSHAQINLADSSHSSYTLTHPDVISFETDYIEDSLCIIGVPQVKLYAETNPAGNADSTDIDFFVRVIDVYPDSGEYFVFEGAVSARAREYARSLANGLEDNLKLTNIYSGKIYEYYFNMLPIAYTFGKNHRLKVLVSSSNYPKYQSNPCIPIEENDFFRRTPNDGKTYSFNEILYWPRISEQKIFFSPSNSSQIILPVYDGVSVDNSSNSKISIIDAINVYPNPTNGIITIKAVNLENIEVFNLQGKVIYNGIEKEIDLSNNSKGIYIIKVTTDKGVVVEKIVVE